jgi:hypothetical protein
MQQRPVQNAPKEQERPVQQPERRRSFRPHWLLWVGLALCVLVGGWMLLTTLVTWWSVSQDDAHYGRPRTFQIDAVVGHNDSPSHPSHFIALNLNRHVLIIELQGGDASKTKIYTGPVLMGDGQDLTPVTISFHDMNHDGKPLMIVHIQNQEIVFANDGTQFKPSAS